MCVLFFFHLLVLRDWISLSLFRMNGDGKMELLFSCIPPWKKKRIPSPFPSRDRRRRRRCIPLLKISSSPLSTSSSSSRRVSFVMRESELEVGEETREKENNKKTKKKRTKMSSFVRLTMDDKFSSSFDRRRRR